MVMISIFINVISIITMVKGGDSNSGDCERDGDRGIDGDRDDVMMILMVMM